MVWGLRDRDGFVLFWIDGPQLCNCGLGGHPTRSTELCTLGDGSIRKGLYAQCRIHVDDVQLHLQRGLRSRHAKEDKADQFQGL